MHWRSTLSGGLLYLRALQTLPSGDDETTVLAVPDFFEMTGKRAVWCSKLSCADPSGRAIEDVSLRPLACWDFGFESRRRHGCLL